MIDKARLHAALQVRDRYTALDHDTEDLDTIVVRINTRQPGKPNLSDFVGVYTAADAYALASEMALILGGSVNRTALRSLRVVWGADSPVYLSMVEVAELCGLAEQSIRVYRSRGKLPAPDVMIGKTPGWLPETIEEYRKTLPGQGARTDLTNSVA